MAPRFEFEHYLRRLRELPFTKNINFHREETRGHLRQADGRVELTTPQGTYKLVVEAKGTFLDHTLTNALVIQKRQLTDLKTGLLLFAPYIPQPTGEVLIKEGVNFVDGAGNIHLVLGDAYQVTKLGFKKPATRLRAGTGPATAQIQFVLLADPEAATWPVRTLAEAAGVGKTIAAEIKTRLIRARLLGKDRILDPKQMEQQFLAAYGNILRPNLLIGTFQPQEKNPEALTNVFQEVFDRNQVLWALTGAAGEFELEKYYRGETTTAYVGELTKEVQHDLRLVPDPRGPVTLLRMFGARAVWKATPRPVAHPLLIYAELLYQGNPRDLDAAAMIKERYLQR